MKQLFAALICSLGLIPAAQAIAITSLPAGTVITLPQRLEFSIGAQYAAIGSIPVGADAASCYLIVKEKSVKSGLVLNSPIQIEVTEVTTFFGYDYSILGKSNKSSFESIQCNENVTTIAALVEVLATQGGQVQLPAPTEE